MSVGLLVKLVAKDDKAEELGALLERALPLAQAEEGTHVWLAIRANETTFWIADVHPDDAARQAHLDGAIAASIMQQADELLSEPPRIEPTSIIAVKSGR